MKISFLSFIILILILLTPFQVHSLPLQNKFISYKYSTNFKLLGNSSLSPLGIHIGYSFEQNVSGMINIQIFSSKKGCDNLSIALNGSSNYVYKIGFISKTGKNFISQSFTNTTCYFNNLLYSFLKFPSNYTGFLNYPVGINTLIYKNLTFAFNGLKMIENFPTVSYTFSLYYKFLNKNNFFLNETTIKLNSTFYNSLDFGFPIYVNFTMNGVFNSSKLSNQKQLNYMTLSFLSYGSMVLYSTNLKSSSKIDDFKFIELKTSTNTTFFVISNKTIQGINILGDEMNITLNGNGNSSIFIIYGGENLLISYNNFNIVYPNNSTELLYYYFINYATFFMESNSNNLVINLGANVGSANFSSTSSYKFSYGYIIIIILIAISIMLIYIAFIRKRTKR